MNGTDGIPKRFQNPEKALSDSDRTEVLQRRLPISALTATHRQITVAVGTTIADRPPRRSVRARLRIRLLPRISSGKAGIRIGMLLAAHRAVPGTCVPRSESGACEIERCSPWSAPFPPQPPRKVALPCSTGSQVIRRCPTSPERSCPPFGLWPSRTGLGLSTKTYRRSPGSRACCFFSVRGF